MGYGNCNCSLWFCIECDDTLFVDSVGNVIPMFNKTMVDIIQSIGIDDLDGFIIYDCTGLYIVQLRDKQNITLPYNASEPKLRNLKYMKAKNGHWYLKMFDYYKFVE